MYLTVLPTELVGPGRAIRLTGPQPDHGGDRRVGAELVPAVRGVEIMVTVHTIEEARRIVGENLDVRESKRTFE